MIERCIFIICLDKEIKSEEETNGNASIKATCLNENVSATRKLNPSPMTDEEAKNRKCSLENKENHLLTQTNQIESQTNCNETNDLISKSMSSQAFQMLHGCNSHNNSGNRWFDKTMQFIIAEDGVCGINYEHSASEGIVVIELSEHLFRYM